MVSTGTLYFVAAIQREKWIPIKLACGAGSSGDKPAAARGHISAPPSQPPPRAPPKAAAEKVELE
jgi:hypothetical protein